jgi:hypothetical protein
MIYRIMNALRGLKAYLGHDKIIYRSGIILTFLVIFLIKSAFLRFCQSPVL